MAAAFYFFVGALVFWLAYRAGTKRTAQPLAQEAEIEQLNMRLSRLEGRIRDHDV